MSRSRCIRIEQHGIRSQGLRYREGPRRLELVPDMADDLPLHNVFEGEDADLGASRVRTTPICSLEFWSLRSATWRSMSSGMRRSL